MNWYVQAAISTGLAFLQTYVMRSPKFTPERKAAFTQLMTAVNVFVVELESPTA